MRLLGRGFCARGLLRLRRALRGRGFLCGQFALLGPFRLRLLGRGFCARGLLRLRRALRGFLGRELDGQAAILRKLHGRLTVRGLARMGASPLRSRLRASGRGALRRVRLGRIFLNAGRFTG